MPKRFRSQLLQIYSESEQYYAARADQLLTFCDERMRKLPEQVAEVVRAHVVFLVWYLTVTPEGRRKLLRLNSPEGYVSRAIRNAVADELPSKDQRPVPAGLVADEISPGGNLEKQELRAVVRAVFAGLSILHQQLLYARHLLGQRGSSLAGVIAPDERDSIERTMRRALRDAENEFRTRMKQRLPWLGE